MITNMQSIKALHEYLLEVVESSNIDSYDYYRGQVHFAYAVNVIDDKLKDKLIKMLEKRRHVFDK